MAPNEQFGGEEKRSPLEPQQRFTDIPAAGQHEAAYRPTIPPVPEAGRQGQTGGTRPSSEQTGERMKQSARETGERIREQGASFLSQQKGRAADELSHFGHAIQRAAESLHNEQDHRIADYADSMARRTEQAANYLRSNDTGRFVEDVEHFVRRRPEVAFGGLFLAGLAISRFLKSSSRPSDVTRSPRQDVAVPQHQGTAISPHREFAGSQHADVPPSF